MKHNSLLLTVVTALKQLKMIQIDQSKAVVLNLLELSAEWHITILRMFLVFTIYVARCTCYCGPCLVQITVTVDYNINHFQWIQNGASHMVTKIENLVMLK